jgi:hypothetical protein
LTKNVSEIRGGKVAADFAAILAQLNHLREERMYALLQIDHGFAHWGGREVRL